MYIKSHPVVSTLPLPGLLYYCHRYYVTGSDLCRLLYFEEVLLINVLRDGYSWHCFSQPDLPFGLLIFHIKVQGMHTLQREEGRQDRLV